MTITEFLTARYDEDEADTLWDNGQMVRVDLIGYLGRGRADIAAKRAIVELHSANETVWPKADGLDEFIERNCTECGTGTVSWGPGDPGVFEPTKWPCPTLRTLAQPYADHPDFDPAWRAT